MPRPVARPVAALAAALSLSACAGSQSFYDDTHLVAIDGRDFMVRQLPGRPSGYHAVINKPEGSTIFTADPALATSNVRAIERHTGCEVIPETIDNRGINTFAAVACS